jgi:hypothetical protein
MCGNEMWPVALAEKNKSIPLSDFNINLKTDIVEFEIITLTRKNCTPIGVLN